MPLNKRYRIVTSGKEMSDIEIDPEVFRSRQRHLEALRSGKFIRVLRIRMSMECHIDLVLLSKRRETLRHGHLSRRRDHTRSQNLSLLKSPVEVVVGE